MTINEVVGAVNRIIRVKEVARKTGFAVSTVWWKVKNEPDFPRPAKIGLNSTGWVESEIDDWIKARLAARRNGGAK